MIGTTIRGFVFSLMIIIPDLCTPVSLSTPAKSDISTVPELTLENVYKELLFKDVQYPEVVLRQVILETQWLKCRNCSLKFNNLFGFMTKKGYIKFKNWVHCINFYKQWQTKVNVEKYNNYYTLLTHARFATAPDYNLKLKSVDISSVTGKFQKSNRD